MPELSNIQTYQKIIGNDFKPTLKKFAELLEQIELWNEEIREAVNSFRMESGR